VSKIKTLVERALIEFPITRGSDHHLMIAVWHYQGIDWDNNPKQFILHKGFNCESMTRHRRKFQEQGLYLPEEKIVEARYSKYKEVKNGNLEVL
jgi:hypothetical protein